MALTAEQQENVRIIVRVGEGMGLDDQTIAAAVATAMMESGLVNNPGGDRDSAGLFQQRPSQGWGTLEQVTDPEYAAKRFFQAYTRSQGATVLERIANTQRPAAEFRDRYAQHFGAAIMAVSEMTGRTIQPLSGAPVAESPVSVESEMAEAAVSNPGSRLVLNADGTISAEDADEITPDSTPEEVEAYIAENYPDVAPFLENEAIKWILYDAAINERDATEIMAAIRQTEYWQTHGPESRAFDALLAEDPLAARQTVDDERVRIRNLMSRNDVELTTGEEDMLIMASIRGGWSDQELNSWLAGNLRARRAAPGEQGLGGEVELDAADLGAIAASYFVPLAKADLGDWALKIMDGSETMDSFTAYVMDMSRGRFSNDQDVLGAIDRGISPDRFFSPIRNEIANVLEMNPESVDLFGDPRFSAVTQFFDPEAKMRRSMTLYETRQWARNQDEYKHTDQYQQQDASMTDALLRTFGAIA